MKEQYEREEIERQRAKIIAEEEARNLQRRLKRLQDGEHHLALPTVTKSSPLSMTPVSTPQHLNKMQHPSILHQQSVSPKHSQSSFVSSPTNFNQNPPLSLSQSPLP